MSERGPGPFFGENMAKRAKNIWPQVVDFNNLLEAFRMVRKGKRDRTSVAKLYFNLDDRLFDLRDSLTSHSWHPGKWREFVVNEVKPRFIQAPAAEDRIVHWALMLQAAWFFERRFIYDSYACRVGKGAHRASKRTTQYLREATRLWGNPYVIKGDISKYFPSIDQAILMETITDIIADRDVLWLFDLIIRAEQYQTAANVIKPAYGAGICIGALTSQWLANLYFDPIDHFIKETLGVKFYLRYMDDFVVIGPTKAWCHMALDTIEKRVNLRKLRLNPKTDIYPASHGIDFVGYRHWTDHTLPRKRTVKRARRLFAEIQRLYEMGEVDISYITPRVASFTGYMQHCDGYQTLDKILDRFVLVRGGGAEGEWGIKQK